MMRRFAVLLAVLAASLTSITPATSATPVPRAAALPPRAADPGDPGDPGVGSGDPGDPLKGARVFEGQGFDTCRTPSYDTMRAWRSSPFRAVGVYFGGRARHCQRQENLTRDWVRRVSAMGWNVLPVYVGSQAPCVHARHKHKYAMSQSGAGAQGEREARDAVARAGDLGLRKNSALYLDMEAYDHRNARCATTTLSFIQSWTRTVRALGYIPCFYSSADHGIAHMERARVGGKKDLPYALWFARWRVPASVYGEKRLDKNAWRPHRRIHQYEGNVTRRYGGREMHIDRNLVDAPVAVTG